ncbi:meckelin [Venturia canescens]|uniref:meckelin n=1 Tax=Venturia canescens TaxID=32260 RepID=UPI001C9CA11A|nr:meckelin [Venturia canescens]
MNQTPVKVSTLLFFYFSSLTSPIVHCESEDQGFEWSEPSSCRNKDYEFFHTDLFRCEKCPSNLVASNDGYECVCDKRSKTAAFKDGLPVCVSCGVGKIRTTDEFECISCRDRGKFCGCLGNSMTVERNGNGTLLDTQQCLPCPKNTFASHDHVRCLPCSEIWANVDRDDFPLDDPSWNNLVKYCMPIKAPEDWPDLQNTYVVKFQKKRIHIDSYYFRRELRFIFHSCKNGIRKACSQLANMCSLTLFATDSIACKLFLGKNELGNRPKIFYREDEARIILNRRTITQRYTLDQDDQINNKLKLVVAKFGLRGKFEAINEPNLPCPFFGNLPFGVNLFKKCRVSATELTDSKMTFLVPFLAYYDKMNSNKRILHPVPVLIKNINEQAGEDSSRWQLVKRFFSVDKITGYRAISNSKNSSFSKGSELHVLRYIKSLQLVVKLQERAERGKVFPPLLVVEYDELTNREIIENVQVPVEYKVSYSFPDDEANGAIEVCIGIFTGLAVTFAMVQAWSYSRRSCQNLASVSTFLSFIIYCFAAVANILIIICSGFCIYTFIFYKGQKVVHVLLPNSKNEWTIKICTIISFAFKMMEMLSLVYHQRRTNIFFIDWEQPRIMFEAIASTNKWDSPRLALRKHFNNGGKLSSSNERRKNMQSASEIIGARRKKTASPSRSFASVSSSRDDSIDNEIPNDNPTAGQPVATVCSETDFSINEENSEEKNHSVSIWRTCVVANEWLRIKTKRKINILFQIFATLFFLEIIGGKNSSKTIPNLVIEPDETLSTAESFTLQYAVGMLIYLLVYTSQWWFFVFIYQKYVKNQLQEFVDLCSMANVSVFMLSHDYYGYYIHGRSVHGFADTDLLTLIKDLEREENDLCAHRGLIPGTTEQTFVISVSKTFRTFYERLVGSQNSRNGRFLRSNISNVPTDWDERWKIYLKLKKFFTGFIDHCYKNVDYTVKDRHFIEKMCDFEMADVHEKSIFYVDNAYSFDRTIFHGNEWTLATFEINVFLLVLVFWENFILASFAVLLVSKLIDAVVQFNGKSLLAEKTFIDERFLVS